ncbi:MAG: nucleotidyltransferase domain-containing protein [Terriglobales bacterium]
MKLTPQAALDKITAWLVQLYGDRLQSLLVYGSLASGHHGKRSDINLLAVLDQVDAAALDLGAPAIQWWTEQGNSPVVLLSRSEQQVSAELFPIESLDIQANHRLLHGTDFFAAAAPLDLRSAALHRRQVAQELRGKLLRLRAAYMSAGRNPKRLEAALFGSVSTLLTLFRHALVAVGEPLRIHKSEVASAAAARFHFPAAPLQAILEARGGSGHLGGGKLEPVRALFSQYLDAIAQVESALAQTIESEKSHAD